MRQLQLGILAALVWLMPGLAFADLRLVMFEQVGCSYCAQWHEQIGPIYPLSAEGKAAPLQRVDIHDPLPEGMVVSPKPVFTPTFVLTRDGAEVDRLQGYPGEDFFWALIGQMILRELEGRDAGPADGAADEAAAIRNTGPKTAP